ncbi:MAG TPA: acetyl-CoA carboxylase biotin carboxyl carrier protein [Bryobacteraceae bacterium]|jgi:acetyl-CoA carboxylase biotin carboxyl carrier protein|nr:acetyl-CoA carboxylase biotin carboxyl carrier protein [Bryobacteraceae bacterium]
MTVADIRELINLALETGIAELEVQRGDNRVRIRRALGGEPPAPVQSVTLPAESPVAAPAPVVPAAPTAQETGPDPTLTTVRSPIVGTFYESSAPGTPPFVRIGERVQPGKVLCIIESMKLMNEIEAEINGIVESKLVQNGQPVEYGEALFAIRAV